MPSLEGCRLPLIIGLLPLPVAPIPTAMTCPLRSAGITPLQHYYEAVRPSPAHRYFRPRVFLRLCLFPWHRRLGSQVPSESPNESHASSTPDAAWPVSRLSARLFPEQSEGSGFDVINDGLRCFSQRFACARLSHPYMTRSKPRLLTMTLTTAAFDRSSSWQFEASSYTETPRGHPSSLLQHDARASS